jgi:transposase
MIFLKANKAMLIHRNLTDAQWGTVEDMFYDSRARKDPRGRPPHNPRAVLNGVLWIMITGETWATLPGWYPDYRSCHRHFKAWYESGILLRVLEKLFDKDGRAAYDAMTARMHTRPRIKAARKKHAESLPTSGYCQSADAYAMFWHPSDRMANRGQD